MSLMLWMAIHFKFLIMLDFIFTNPHPTLYSHLFEIRIPEAILSMLDESAKPFSLQCPSEISACKPQSSLISPTICLCCRQYLFIPYLRDVCFENHEGFVWNHQAASAKLSQSNCGALMWISMGSASGSEMRF